MTPLGPYVVGAGRAEVEAFAAATGAMPGDAVPATFAMRWLAAPEIRAALLALAPEPDLVPVHESQSFEYLAPLVVGARYALALAARRESAPDRLIVAGTISDDEGAPHVRVETILRLFSTEAEAA